jgi:transposase-like protein
MPKRYESEMKARAVRMVREQLPNYPTETAACEAVAKTEGVGREALGKWVQQCEVDDGVRDGVTTAEAEEMTSLRKGNTKLREQVEILAAAASFFVGALDSRKR